MREDFIAPLREGIQQYRSKVQGKNSNLRLYHNVYLFDMKIDQYKGLLYNMALDSNQASKVRWENSQRLMFGNLLIISSDNFETYTFLTVEDRSNIEKYYTFVVNNLGLLRNSRSIYYFYRLESCQV